MNILIVDDEPAIADTPIRSPSATSVAEAKPPKACLTTGQLYSDSNPESKCDYPEAHSKPGPGTARLC